MVGRSLDLTETAEPPQVLPERPAGLDYRPMALKDSREKLGLVSELWAFMKVRKKWWLGPIVVMLVLLGLLIVLTQGSAVAPFIYTLF